jgi:hypothetical protein
MIMFIQVLFCLAAITHASPVSLKKTGKALLFAAGLSKSDAFVPRTPSGWTKFQRDGVKIAAGGW